MSSIILIPFIVGALPLDTDNSTEPILVIRASDRHAPEVIQRYKELVRLAGGDPDLLRALDQHLEATHAYRSSGVAVASPLAANPDAQPDMPGAIVPIAEPAPSQPQPEPVATTIAADVPTTTEPATEAVALAAPSETLGEGGQS